MQSAKDDNLIGASAADRLIAAHDGDVALLYLYIRRSGAADTEGAARALCRTLGEMEAALEKLGRMGLLADVPAAMPAGQDRFPPADETGTTRRFPPCCWGRSGCWATRCRRPISKSFSGSTTTSGFRPRSSCCCCTTA